MLAPLVSIIIPAYNCGKYIQQAIDSIINQTYKNLEIFIADDASSDNTKAIIDAYSDIRIKRFHNDSNIGYLKTCNKLFKSCTGDFITFQDADDWSDMNRIQTQVSYMYKNYLSVSSTGCYRVTESGDIYEKWLPIEGHNDFLNNAKIEGTVRACCATLMITSKVLKDVGGYREYFNGIGAEAYDWLYFILKNNRIKNIQKPLYYYRKNLNSISNNINFLDTRLLSSSRLAYLLFKERLSAGDDSLMRNDIAKLKLQLIQAEKLTNVHSHFITVFFDCISSGQLFKLTKCFSAYFWKNKFTFKFWYTCFYILLRLLLGRYFSKFSKFIKSAFNPVS